MTTGPSNVKSSARTPAIVAVTTALLIAVQYALSFVPGVELVTVTFVAFSCVFGKKRGVITAIAYSLLRQIVFGIYVPVLILYLVYFPLVALVFGTLGKRVHGAPPISLTTTLAVVLTLCFTLMDNVLTPLWFGYSKEAFLLYFKASLPFALIQCACVGASTLLLVKPLTKAFARFA